MGQATEVALSDSDCSTEGEGEVLTEYEYKTLVEPHTVRILNLRPGGKDAGEVVCELVDENLDQVKSKYEALSWSWGTVEWDQKIQIHHRGKDFFFKVPGSLTSALKALRSVKRVRRLWIDAICINQKEPDEKNKQVPMMAKIYGGASSVCIWLGEGDSDGRHAVALDFIKDEVLKLQSFDELCDNPEASHKWKAMLDLMKRPWFSRRWVVQEIALANSATIYCGEKTIPWKDFSDAVQLFVEVETATHRLSDVMKKDPNFYHVPGWFEYVSALGASLLINATGNLFRRSKDKRQPLLGLESLVSSLSLFEATEPHDTIYSLLAIAKDTSPIAVNHGPTQSVVTPAASQLSAWAYRHIKARRYEVDYKRPFRDICAEFILFSIRQSDQKARALDIICRPWAPPRSMKKLERKGKGTGKQRDASFKEDETDNMPSWISRLDGAVHAMYTHPDGEVKMGRQNADSLVGLPGLNQMNYNAAGTKQVNMGVLKFWRRKSSYSMYVQGFQLDRVNKVEVASQGGAIPKDWVDQAGWKDTREDPPEEFWRTLVADRGRHGRNPPTYYARACKESITKGLRSGALNTTALINDGRCSVVAEFFRRVQAVIWNRSLMRTEMDHLGIGSKEVKKDDLVCILFGCSVPVVLRRHRLSMPEVVRDEKEDMEEFDLVKEKAAIRIQRGFRESKARRAKLKLLREKKEGAAQQKSVQVTVNGPLPANHENSRSSEEKAEGALVTANGAVTAEVKEPQPSTEEDPGWTKKGEMSALLNRQNNSGEKKSNHKSSPETMRRKMRSKSWPSEAIIQRENKSDASDREKKANDSGRFYYEFIGECYVHGMMDGEALEYQNFKQIKPRTFELR